MTDKEYHFIGLGGIGMSALASILLDKQVKVAGSDISENYVVKKLVQKGAHFLQGHDSNHIAPEQTIVYTSSVKAENPEIQAAQKLQCKILHRSDLLKELMEGYYSLAVAGTHGKTTTSALLVHILTEAGYDPSYAIGGLLAGENGKWGGGKHFVAEADESDGTFLKYFPYGAIVTNVEKEHMDYYGTEENLHQAFRTFFSQVTSLEHLFYCGDDPLLSFLSQGRGISYGFNSHCQLRISSFVQTGWNIQFTISWKGKVYESIVAPLVGKMHALNISAAFGLSLSLGIEEDIIRQAIKTFSGVKRRLEKKGEVNNILFLDDYGHHPTEIRVTLAALKEAIGERRLIVLFQPHRYSRTKDLLSEFATSFERADLLYVTDIYAAQEAPLSDITPETLVKKIHERGTIPALYLPKTHYIEELKNVLRPHDVLITLGAGDITNFSYPLIAELEKNPPQKYRLGLLFGGKSAEHEISLRSARFVLDSLNPNYYEISFFGIDKKGEWILEEEAKNLLLEKTEVKSAHAYPLLSKKVSSALNECDIFFPVLHGPNGEDGTLQGFFEVLGKPYAGPDFRSCSVTMDKILTKRLFMSCGVPTAKFHAIGYRSWLKNKEEFFLKIQDLSYPLYVKPAKMGSSIGVTCVESKDFLEEAINLGFRFDNIVLVEEGVVGAREFEFAVMGNHHEEITVTDPGEKCSGGSFVDYQKKYSQNPTPTTIYPQLEDSLIIKAKEYVRKAYEGLGITCVSRVDCLIDTKGNFCFTEVNAIPGMTHLSLFPKMWQRDGINARTLMDSLILFGLSRRRDQNRHERML